MEAAGPFDVVLQWLQAHLPAPLGALPGWLLLIIVLGILLVGALIVLAILAVFIRVVFGRGKAKPLAPSLEEDLATYPPAPTSSGDRRLMVEGVPVRLRLVVIAPAGKLSEFDPEQLEPTLEQILPGLGQICKYDKPRCASGRCR